MLKITSVIKEPYKRNAHLGLSYPLTFMLPSGGESILVATKPSALNLVGMSIEEDAKLGSEPVSYIFLKEKNT